MQRGEQSKLLLEIYEQLGKISEELLEIYELLYVMRDKDKVCETLFITKCLIDCVLTIVTLKMNCPRDQSSSGQLVI